MRRRSQQVVLLFLVVAATVVVAACNSETPAPNDSSAKERVRVSGSGTCLPLMRVLTERYEQDHAELEFVYLPGLHSGGGIKGVASGDLELGAVSRSLNADENDLGLTYVQLADDGLVIAVHPSVTIDELTSQQVRDIYSGKYDNWAQLGGPDLPMVILDRNEDESAKIILRQYVLGADMVVTDKAINLFYEPDMVEGLVKSPGAIGYFSLGLGLSDKVAVRYLKLDGVVASVEDIDNGSYPVIRPLGLVFAPSASSEIRDFAKWAVGDEAIALMRERGFAPVVSTAGE